jgi:hypothetical protein
MANAVRWKYSNDNLFIKKIFVLDAFLYADPGSNASSCPPNADNYGNQCRCKDGYQTESANNRTCGKMKHEDLLIKYIK